MSNGETGGRKLGPTGVCAQLGWVVSNTLKVRGERGLDDGGIVFSVSGPARGRWTVTVHLTSQDLYNVSVLHHGTVVASAADVYPDSIGAVVRQLVEGRS